MFLSQWERQLSRRVITRGLKVGVVGAGNMGRGIALSLARSGHHVVQFDREPELAQQSATQHERLIAAASIGECCTGSDAVLVSVSNEAAERKVFLGERGLFSTMVEGSLCANLGTTSVAWARELHASAVTSGMRFLDAPVSGGPEGASAGRLTVMVGGPTQVYRDMQEVLDAFASKHARLGDAGAGAAAKLVNQLLVVANAHAAAEGLALATALGCDLAKLRSLLETAWGQSTMLSRCADQLLSAATAALDEESLGSDARPFASLLEASSAAPLRNFVKDVGLIEAAASTARIGSPSAATARRTLQRCAAIGRLDADWAAVTALMAKEPVEEKWTDILGRAPPLLPEAVVEQWRRDIVERAAAAGPVPVIDDDPTGTQTVHSVSVLSYPWRDEDLDAEMRRAGQLPSCFFALANTRALEEEAAVVRAEKIGSELAAYRPRVVVSRSDSTLRGHFPAEVHALARGLGWTKPLVVVAPFFFEGGRVTTNDIHYVVAGDVATPAAQTEFATDAAFAYKSSNLRDWVREKGAQGPVASVGVELLRSGPEAPTKVADLLVQFYRDAKSNFPVVIANALDESDAIAFALGCLEAEARLFHTEEQGGLIFRSAASLVAARCAVPKREPLDALELGSTARSRPGLVVVGSYVGKTTSQLEYLLKAASWLDCIEIDAAKAAEVSTLIRNEEIARVTRDLVASLKTSRSAVLYTSRRLVRDERSSLEIGDRINDAVCTVVRAAVDIAKDADVFVVAKGGITSNDVAVKSLGVRRATVLGQVIPGVPAWRLGSETAKPGAAYVVFPGNVGTEADLAKVVAKLAGRPLRTGVPRLQELLLEARHHGRAIGAFNVYNIEGALAVQRAVQATGLPAIIQFHKAALDLGGASLVSACLEIAAASKTAPLLVALDHATDDRAIDDALQAGVHAVMADGSALPLDRNVSWTADVVKRAKSFGAAVEAELGMLAGEEDGLSVDERDARMTDPDIVADFVRATQISALACTVGNVHGKYAKAEPDLDWDRLDAIRARAPDDLPLVLHGASGLPIGMLHRAIRAGVCKFNVNTEVRAASRRAVKAASDREADVLDIMKENIEAMAAVVEAKIRAFSPRERL